MVRSLVLAVALALVGCGGGSDNKPAPTTQGTCEAGRVVECPCGGGVSATQTCKGDGSGWLSCECPDPQTDPKLACMYEVDQTIFPDESQRCPNTFTMFLRCEQAAVDTGSCFRQDGNYCCFVD